MSHAPTSLLAMHPSVVSSPSTRPPDNERLIMRLYHQDELTQAEIGRRLGYSQMHISRLLHKATEQLRLAAAQDADATQVTAA